MKIDVYKIEVEGFGSYYDKDIEGVKSILESEVDYDQPVIVTKEQMEEEEFENLPEFEGF